MNGAKIYVVHVHRRGGSRDEVALNAGIGCVRWTARSMGAKMVVSGGVGCYNDEHGVIR